jgi:hypothetical protein
MENLLLKKAMEGINEVDLSLELNKKIESQASGLTEYEKDFLIERYTKTQGGNFVFHKHEISNPDLKQKVDFFLKRNIGHYDSRIGHVIPCVLMEKITNQKIQMEEKKEDISFSSFGEVIEAVKEGLCAKRSEWPGSKFIFMRPAHELTPKFIVDKMTSLPQSVKNHIARKYGDETHYSSGEEIQVRFTGYLCLYNPDGHISNGWAPSQEDMLEEDWIILE